MQIPKRLSTFYIKRRTIYLKCLFKLCARRFFSLQWLQAHKEDKNYFREMKMLHLLCTFVRRVKKSATLHTYECCQLFPSSSPLLNLVLLRCSVPPIHPHPTVEKSLEGPDQIFGTFTAESGGWKGE
ncbi:unnamed protein product [Gulo gulo]|uniref:Uncharacterized protein n=1 Tax=Gulo gulo TaxID=48420 RepID=A0A9X9Q3B1_GULGU|nr:unnamed protein product [Gulo gulo]